MFKTEINSIDEDHYDEYFGEVEAKFGDNFINDDNLVNEIKVEASEEKLFDESFNVSEIEERIVSNWCMNKLCNFLQFFFIDR